MPMPGGDYRLIAQAGDTGAVGVGAQRDGRRVREGLRLFVGSCAAVALLAACAWTTLRGSMYPGSADSRLAQDTQLIRTLAHDGLTPYADVDGFRQRERAPTPGRHGDDAPRVEGLNNGNKRKGSKRKAKNHHIGEDGPCSRKLRRENPQCAKGRLEIESITPTTCKTGGGCIITFTGKNIVAGADLYGHKADELMSVSLLNDGAEVNGGAEKKVVSKCSSINWIDNKRFECEIGPGTGSGLGWNVSIPTHDKALKKHGMGWTWASVDGFRFSGKPCDENVCGFIFEYLGPTVNQIEPDVLDVGEKNIILIHGANFGEKLGDISINLGGIPCEEMELVNDNLLRCLIEPVMEVGITTCTIDVAGQSTQANIPVKDIPEARDWPFTAESTFGTEQWNITMAVIMEQSGLSKDWFETNQATILSPHTPANVAGIMAQSGLEEWEGVAVKLFRDYLQHHFDSAANHGVEDEDGVYLRALGNKLNGNKEHDTMVDLKQLQVMEAATGESRQKLQRIVGDVVEEDPPCAGYPNCAPADAVGHRGWTWHWVFDDKRNAWAWEYAPISDGQDPPVSCGYCDPVKVRRVLAEEEAKQREETCMLCVTENFKNMDSCQCSDFKHMCLQSTASVLNNVAPKPEPDMWNFCAAEGEACDCHGQVRYGAVGLWSESIESSSETHCDNKDFGDPAFGVVKHCECLATSQTLSRDVPQLHSIEQLSGGGKRRKKHVEVPGNEPFAASSPLVNPPFQATECFVKAAANNCSQLGGLPSEDGLSCCPAACGGCGGEGCASWPGGSEACCLDGLSTSGVKCGTPPCIMQDDPATVRDRQEACESYGGIHDPNSLQCCAGSCGVCGGESCNAAPGGEENCCLDNIAAMNRGCSSSTSAPCTLSAGGGPGSEIESEDPAAEAQRNAEAICKGNGKREACKSNPLCSYDSVHGCVVKYGVDWSNTDMSDWVQDESGWHQSSGARDRSGQHNSANKRLAKNSNACSDSGGIVDPLGTACCPRSCGTCGGDGCAAREGGANACCADNIASAATACGSPPCSLGAVRSASAAAADRVSTCEQAGGISDGTGLRCCSVSCGTCGGIGCEDREGGAEACCVDELDSANAQCGTPPCLTESKQTCQARNLQGHADLCAEMGGVSDPFGSVCCAGSCGKCGGEECDARNGGAESCCSDGIVAADIGCGSPPCMWPVNPSAVLERESSCVAAGGISDPTGMRCCSLSCGTCGGEDCAARDGGASSCCIDDLDAANVPCGTAPCLMESAASFQQRESARVQRTCLDAGGIPDALGLYCCAGTCGVCGGVGCEMSSGQAAGCCADSLASANEPCGDPPCAMAIDPAASSARVSACQGLGGIPDSTGMLCCESSCGSCGGAGCEGRQGGADACCADNLEEANVACGNPPCLMETHAQAQARDAQVYSAKCTQIGGIPDPTGLTCCAPSCGICGGEGCELRPGGAELCCGDNLATANETCGGPACIFQPARGEVEARSRACELVGGLPGPSGLTCCPETCGTCGGAGCQSRPGGADSCCLDNINDANQLCGEPPCMMLAFSDGDREGSSTGEWWRFSSGDVVARAATQVRATRTAAGSSEDTGFAASLFLPTEMRDKKVSVGAGEAIAEWSPQRYVSIADYPRSRLAGGIGAAGSSIRDPTVIVCWSLFLLVAISLVIYVLIFHRTWFVPGQGVVVSEELLAPGSPRSVGSV